MTSPSMLNANSKISTLCFSITTRSESTTSNDDLMKMLTSLKNEFLALSESQASQFQSLKNDLKKLVVQFDDLKTLNSKLQVEVNALKKKVSVLKVSSSIVSFSNHAPTLVSQVLHETFERVICIHPKTLIVLFLKTLYQLFIVFLKFLICSLINTEEKIYLRITLVLLM